MAATPCLFCQIAAGEIPASIVFDDSRMLAFLDHRPLFPGHCLLIPRQHFETIADLPAEHVGPLFEMARTLCVAVETGLGAEGSFLAVNNRVSQSVAHLHIHVVPRRKKDGLRGFFWPRGKYRDETERDEVRDVLRRTLESLKKPAA
ncbi:MAG TPA: HIT family protein [Bryobacteraceae bacterium]|nr:HIT family protein [Bryobacteraceae bacterium]